MRLPALERGPCSVSFGASNHHCSDVLDTRSAQGGGYGVQRAPVVITSSTRITRLPFSCEEMFGSTMNALHRLFKR